MREANNAFYKKSLIRADDSVEEAIEEFTLLRKEELVPLRDKVNELYSWNYVNDISDSEVWLSQKVEYSQNKIERFNKILIELIDLQSEYEFKFQALSGRLGSLSVVQNSDYYEESSDLVENAENISVRFVAEIEKPKYQKDVKLINELIDFIIEETQDLKEKIQTIKSELN